MRSLGVFALTAIMSLFPSPAGAAPTGCAYFEDSSGTFFIDLQTGSWRLVSPFDVSGGPVDELRLTESRGRFSDTSASGAQLRGAFQVGGPGSVTYQDASTSRSVRIHDRNVQVAACN